MAYKDLERRKASLHAYYLAHREQWKASGRAWYLAHRGEVNGHQRVYNQRMFAEALLILGSMCACPGCGMDEPLFLTIDHIHGRPKGSRKDALKEAKASGWDKSKFQMLCWNCNMAKSNRGFCPVHQTDPGQRNGHSPTSDAQLSLLPLMADT